MKININQTVIKENPVADSLLYLLKSQEISSELSDSEIYYDYPVYSEGINLDKSGFLIISKKHGLLLIKCLDYSQRSLSKEILKQILTDFEQIYSSLFSKLIKNRELRLNVNQLKIPIKPLIFLESQSEIPSFESSWEELRIFNNLNDFKTILSNNRLSTELEEEILKRVIATIEGSSALIKPPIRSADNSEDSKGRILDKIESQISVFDNSQKRAALTIVDGPQRIRGLAGTGKTIVLTMKVAQIHLSQPEAKIIYTYSTKNLYEFIKRLITRFYREFSDKDPDWSKIMIMHAWGGESLEGTYSMICKENGIKPETLKDNPKFGDVCENVLKSGKELKKLFDYSILDEGQDYPSSFYKLCREVTKNNRIIWAYDECQNIFNMEIQDTVKTFGKDSAGNPHIDFSRDLQESQDLVLDKCYRNPREILIASFALGLGIYGKKIVQMPENPLVWSDLGFKIEQGDYKTDSKMEISLPSESVHRLKDSLLKDKDPLRWAGFEGFDEECVYVAKQVANDLKEGLLPEDISIISIDDRSAKSYFKKVTKLLMDNGINTFNLLEASWDNKTYSLKDHVTLTTVYRAKGNESGSVYILGVDSVYNNLDLRPVIERNKLFVSMTRAKAWVTITGVGPSYKLFEDEIKKITENDFKLIFIMPDFKELNLFKRDLARKQAMMQEARKQLEKVAEKYGYDKTEFVQMHLNF